MGLKWTDNLETGFDRIDDQHKVLLIKLSEFHKACEEGLGRKAIVEMFAFIDRYVTAHFALEEAYMMSKRYPQLEEHRMAHDRLREEYKKLTKVLVEDGASPTLVVRANFFLSEWWKDHICTMDKKMVKYTKKTE